MSIIRILVLLLCLQPAYSQDLNRLKILETKRQELKEAILKFQDSLSIVQKEIEEEHSRQIYLSFRDTVIIAVVKGGAKLMLTADPRSEVLSILEAGTKISILDFSQGVFSVCASDKCGYIFDYWVVHNDLINSYTKGKRAEEDRIRAAIRDAEAMKLESERVVLERKYIRKYGASTYNKLKAGKIWIGITREMAIIALGGPSEINRTVGLWGIHEQWVYKSVYLYFENGKLSSYQD